MRSRFSQWFIQTPRFRGEMKGGEGEVQTERPFLLSYRKYWGNSEVLGESSPLTGLDKTLDTVAALYRPMYNELI
jgi:hypothetical protein